MSVGSQIYKHLPVWAQHCAVTSYGAYWYWVRFGAGYESDVRAYHAREKFSSADWKQWQQSRLQDLLRNAATNISHYTARWSPNEKRAALAGQLQDLPLLEKEPIRADPTAFVTRTMSPWPRLTFHTSGSTGTPIRTLWTVKEYRNAMALREARSVRWAGASYGMARATFSGRLAEPNPYSTGPFYRYNAVERQVYFSPYHLRSETAASYVEALRRHKIQWMTGYAVSYFLLAKMILEQGLEVPPLRAIVTTSEKLTAPMRAIMEKAFRTRIYEEYSTVESSLFASECGLGRLHLSPDVAVVEILRPDGTYCDPGEPGEVVATSLIRNYQVFVRYRLGDVAAWDPDPCPCGLSMPVIQEVLGRTEDVVVGVDGRCMVRFHGVFADQAHIMEGQIIQEELDLIHVKVVPSVGFGDADVNEVIRRVRQRLGLDVKVVVEPVSSIPRSRAGKFQSVVSRLPRKETREHTNSAC